MKWSLLNYVPSVPNVPNFLTCQRAMTCYVPTCLRAKFPYVPICHDMLRANVPTCLCARQQLDYETTVDLVRGES